MKLFVSSLCFSWVRLWVLVRVDTRTGGSKLEDVDLFSVSCSVTNVCFIEICRAHAVNNWGYVCTEPRKMVCTWLHDISSWSCLAFMPGPAWLLLMYTFSLISVQSDFFKDSFYKFHYLRFPFRAEGETSHPILILVRLSSKNDEWIMNNLQDFSLRINQRDQPDIIVELFDTTIERKISGTGTINHGHLPSLWYRHQSPTWSLSLGQPRTTPHSTEWSVGQHMDVFNSLSARCQRWDADSLIFYYKFITERDISDKL